MSTSHGQRIGDAIRMQYGWTIDGIMPFPQQKKRRGGMITYVAVPMHLFWLDELAKLPRRAVTLLYDRIGNSFTTTSALQERLRALMGEPAVQEVIADPIARETVRERTTFTFHGLGKNSCCYLLECVLNDSEAGEILSISPDMVRHYGKCSGSHDCSWRCHSDARGQYHSPDGGNEHSKDHKKNNDFCQWPDRDAACGSRDRRDDGRLHSGQDRGDAGLCAAQGRECIIGSGSEHAGAWDKHPSRPGAAMTN